VRNGSDPIEQQIQEAIDRGEFDNLPGAGKPLNTGDEGPGWWARRFLERLRAADRAAQVAHQVDLELGRLWVLSDEASVRERVTELNVRLSQVNQGLAEENRVDLLVADQVVSTWRKMARARRPIS
jgi:hypothetical protein